MLGIRKATPDDVPAILRLVKELAAYEREPDAVVATEDDFLRDGFGEKALFRCHLATWNREPIGFALWFFTFSTWRGKRCLHLEDLFVDPAHRGRGAGLGLMKTLAREAVEAECARFVWQVMDWNEPAIAFYEKLGADVMKEWIAVRLDGEALEKLAAPAAQGAT
jgi:GNAT superfamily N-acetyltransferase